MRRPRDDHPVRLGGRACLSRARCPRWGGFAAFFAHPARLALAAVLFVLTATALFSPGNLSAGEREDRGNRWVIGAVGLIGLVSAYVPAYTDRTDFWTLDGDILRWIGVVLFAAGGVLRLWPVFVLGRRFSGLVAIQRGHALVTSGVYGVIRHPSYLGMIIGALGWALAFRSLVGVLFAALLILPLIARIEAKSVCCARISEPNMKPTAPAPRASSQGSTSLSPGPSCPAAAVLPDPLLHLVDSVAA